MEPENQSTRWLPVSVVSTAAGENAGRLVEFRVGLRTLPYLADHGFHDMVVLPGAFYIELVRQIHRELFGREALSLRRIQFERPVILADDEVVLTVRIEELENGGASYELFEGSSHDIQHAATAQSCARLQVDADGAAASEAFNEASAPATSAEDFYRDLQANGNHYGPAFQVFTEIARQDAHAVGRFAKSPPGPASGPIVLPPPLLDAASQLLSAFALDRGRTFILQSIDRLVVNPQGRANPAAARAVRKSFVESGRPELIGSVRVVDADGTWLWELSGVTLAFINRPGAAEPAPATRLCVAATFTAEPLEDSLRFWGRHFGSELQIDFAPYNQVFQQLLDPASRFHQNRDGFNLLALDLEDWRQEVSRPLPDPAHVAASLGARPRLHLPNGLEVAHLNRYETEYVYQEIFEDQSYLRHGIQLGDEDTVIDIGANIGLFSLFILSRCRNPSIYAYEPSPRVFDLLRANCAAYGDPRRVHAFNSGVSDKKSVAQFTFYEHSSVFSSFHPDEREDRAAVEAVVRNVLQNELSGAERVQDEDIEDLTTHRLRAETIECPLTSVSDIIRENHLSRIHLLKIDAEKCETEILRGIDEAHWPLIEQIVMEVHDRTRATVQAIEEQLTRRGFRCAVVEEKLLENSGLFNVYATRRAAAAHNAAGELDRKVGEFCAALETFAAASPAPLILAIAPRAASAADSDFAVAEKKIAAQAARHSQVRCLTSQRISARYPVREWHDPHGRQLGHVPFTTEGYAALGTALFRAVFSLDRPPVKVIVLDCDHTLWQGLCGEDGPQGVALPPPFRRLQELMVEQAQAGVLLALCSKNQEADVLAVFDQRPDMPLRREHLAAWRINWEPKPQNLRALAAQLQFGLDSFVFIDDNPVECAAVQAACPEVIVLPLPAESERIPGFLENVWIFDHQTVTREDRERGQWYQANAEREEQRAAAPTLRAFLDGLNLRIDVTEADDEQLERVAQLTLRTNQFNLTSLRRSEGEIRALLRSGAKCLVTSVRDRFGDYGLVGAILYTSAADRLIIDTLLLSCRALGKGVEHHMLAELAARALHDGKPLIELPYRQTERNEPARKFLEQLRAGTPLPTEPDFVLTFPSATLAELRYEPDETRDDATPETRAAAGRDRFDRANLSTALQRLGNDFTRITEVVTAIESSKDQPPPAAGPDFAEDASTLERALAAIWKKALGRSQIGLTENFFDAGGTSLKAVTVVAAIRKELKKDLSIVALFECPTIQLLAARLDSAARPGEEASAAAASAESRGRLRRNKLVKRRTA